MKRTLLLTLYFFAGVLYSQHTLSPSGNSIVGSEYTLDYTLGQIAVSSINDEETILMQGLHQGLKIKSLVAKKIIELDVSIWPNPTNNIFHIKTEKSAITYALYNSLQQRAFRKGLIPMNSSKMIDISDLQAAIYLLSLTDENQITRIFRIIKIN